MSDDNRPWKLRAAIVLLTLASYGLLLCYCVPTLLALTLDGVLSAAAVGAAVAVVGAAGGIATVLIATALWRMLGDDGL